MWCVVLSGLCCVSWTVVRCSVSWSLVCVVWFFLACVVWLLCVLCVFLLCVCFSEAFRESLSETFSLVFLAFELASHVLFLVSEALAFPTAYNIKHNAPWISVAYQLIEKQVNEQTRNQLGKGSSHALTSQHDDFSPPA